MKKKRPVMGTPITPRRWSALCHLLFILLLPLLWGATGCDGGDTPPVEIPPVVPTEPNPAEPEEPSPAPPAEPTPRYTMEPGAQHFLKGKRWQLDGILDLETGTLQKLSADNDLNRYTMLFDSDSTAAGRIADTGMRVSLARPFFRLSEETESSEDGQRFARLASAITGCEYMFEDTLMRFYHEDQRTCLVFRCKSVEEKTGLVAYYTFTTPSLTEGRWIVVDRTDGGARGLLIDSGDWYFPGEDFPDRFKQQGLQVKFSGNVARMPYLGIGTVQISFTMSFYSINLSSLEELPSLNN